MENCCREKMINKEIRIFKSGRRRIGQAKEKQEIQKYRDEHKKEDAAEVWKRKTKKWNEVQMRTKEKNRRKNSTEELRRRKSKKRLTGQKY